MNHRMNINISLRNLIILKMELMSKVRGIMKGKFP